MKINEITLCGRQILVFQGKQVATIELRESGDRNDGLTIKYDENTLDLSAAADTSQQLEHPRVFVIEGVLTNKFFLFGGEMAYWLTNKGEQKAETRLFRKWGDEEYWTTKIIDCPGGLVIIYEAGVLLIDDMLRIAWHKQKFYNDDFVACEGNILTFARDNDLNWLIGLEDGHTHFPCNGSAHKNQP